MRIVFAVLAAVLVALTAAAPHAHAASLDGHGCQACVLRGADVAEASPEPAPATELVEDVLREPGLSPVSGRPLGAVPGQSPPRG